MDDTESFEDAASVSVVSEVDKDLARRSRQDFNAGRYVECVQSLLKLSSNRPNDPKVLHNKAVVEYYLSDFKRTDEFKKILRNVADQVHVNLNDVDTLDDVEQCVLYYNQAVILYHLRQYHAALAISDKVFQFVEPLDPRLAKHVCFLLLELYLCTYQPEKALGMTNYIETMLSETAEGENKAAADKEKDAKYSTSSIISDQDNDDREEYKISLQQYKARCYLMLRSLKGCKRELKSLTSSSGLSLTTTYLKANLEYTRGNYRKVIKILNSAPQQTKPFVETGENVPVDFYNNMGCTHFYMGRPNLGYLYFSKALQENENSIKRLAKPEQGINGRPLHTVGANFRYEICYNTGIQLLYAKKPEQAFDFLIEAVQAFPTNPRLWLRIAECCVQLHRPDNEADFRLKESKKNMLQGVIGSGMHRKIILKPYINKPHEISQLSSASIMPSLTLEFASTCLRNAYVLLPDVSVTSGSTLSTSDEPEGSAPDNILVPAPPGNPIRGSEITNLRCSILAASAYVALSIGDVVMGLHYAECLLAQPKLSGAHRYLGHLYAGEAMVYLDRISAAVQHFSQNVVGEDQQPSINLLADREKSTSEEIAASDITSLKGWFPNSVNAANMVLQYNLTVAYTIRGELDKASDILKKINTKGPRTEIPVQALMLAMYIQMQLGHADMAKTIVRQHFPQFR
ncbi:CCR4-NOT transcription complex subunit 10 [Chamberlinius hualienensis]